MYDTLKNMAVTLPSINSGLIMSPGLILLVTGCQILRVDMDKECF